ncbi:magnesium ABC transporter ATPase [Brucella neotomae]|nr:magnesium ABC transporter ATPase [Brucella neotomae]
MPTGSASSWSLPAEIPGAETSAQYRIADEAGLTVQGFLTFLDPPKETAGPAIAALAEHGVCVKVLTGDNEIVTRKICREVGLEAGIPILEARSRNSMMRHCVSLPRSAPSSPS